MSKIDELLRLAEEVESATAPRSITADKIGGMFKLAAELVRESGNIVLKKKTPLLYNVKYNVLDYDFAKDFFKSHYAPLMGSCSVVRKGNKIARNLDWYFNNEVEFVVESEAAFGRHAVKGFAATISTLTMDAVAEGVNGDLAKILPFRMTDGINDAGLYASINVVNANDNHAIADTGTTPIVEQREEICLSMLVRYILDSFSTAEEAFNYIRDYVRVYPPFSAQFGKSDAQILIADKNGNKVINFYGDIVTSANFHGVMTNFRLASARLVNEKYDIENSGIEKFGQGVERANIALEMLKDSSEEEIINALHYTHAYDASSSWLTEFAGINGATIHDTAALTELQARARELFLSTSRYKGDVWHTTHSVVYDLDAMIADFSTQEINDGNSTAGSFELRSAESKEIELTNKRVQSLENRYFYADITLNEESHKLEFVRQALIDAINAISAGKIIVIKCGKNQGTVQHIVTSACIYYPDSYYPCITFLHRDIIYMCELDPTSAAGRVKYWQVFGDAPKDGKKYVRQNGAWVEI